MNETKWHGMAMKWNGMGPNQMGSNGFSVTELRRCDFAVAGGAAALLGEGFSFRFCLNCLCGVPLCYGGRASYGS